MTKQEAIIWAAIYAPGSEDTLRLIIQNRYSHGIKYWSIRDIQAERGLDYDSAKHRYNRHWRQLQKVFMSHLRYYYGDPAHYAQGKPQNKNH